MTGLFPDFRKYLAVKPGQFRGVGESLDRHGDDGHLPFATVHYLTCGFAGVGEGEKGSGAGVFSRDNDVGTLYDVMGIVESG